MKDSVEQRVVKRLRGFTETLRSGEDVAERFTCRQVILNLETSEYSPALVKKTRMLLGLSQAIFAQFLGVSVNTVQSWEQGDNSPSDIARRFMDEIRANPSYWKDRFLQLAEPRA